MKLYTKKRRVQEELASISCDKCKDVFVDDGRHDAEIDNFVTIYKNFQFGSVHDEDIYECDLCEKCAFEVLGKYWKKK